MTSRWALGSLLALTALCVSCSGDSTKPTAGPSLAPTTTTEVADAVELTEGTSVVYVQRLPDGVTTRYTILAPPDDAMVKRINDFHDGVGETRPLRMILAEVDNQSTEDFEVGDVIVTQADGDKVHFIEAWLHVGRWHLNVRGETDSPFYMEGFDLSNDLLPLGRVKAGTKSVTVIGAEDFLESVRSVVARDRSGEMVPLERER